MAQASGRTYRPTPRRSWRLRTPLQLAVLRRWPYRTRVRSRALRPPMPFACRRANLQCKGHPPHEPRQPAGGPEEAAAGRAYLRQCRRRTPQQRPAPRCRAESSWGSTSPRSPLLTTPSVQPAAANRTSAAWTPGNSGIESCRNVSAQIRAASPVRSSGTPSWRHMMRWFGEKVFLKISSSNGKPSSRHIAASVSRIAAIESTSVPFQSKMIARIS